MVALMVHKLDRASQFKDEIHTHASVWWSKTAPYSARFFELSSKFNKVQTTPEKREYLQKMKDHIATVEAIDFAPHIETIREDLLNAMNNFMESMSAGLENNQKRATTCLHNALLDLQHFHVVLDRLDLDYYNSGK